MNDTLVALRLLSPCFWKIGVIMGILITFTTWSLICTWPLWWPERKK